MKMTAMILCWPLVLMFYLSLWIFSQMVSCCSKAAVAGKNETPKPANAENGDIENQVAGGEDISTATGDDVKDAKGSKKKCTNNLSSFADTLESFSLFK